MPITDRIEAFLKRHPRLGRKAAGSLAAGLALTSCSATTTEGVATAQCTDGTATYQTIDGDKIDLGDRSSDEALLSGRHNDWAWVQNNDGKLDYNQEKTDGIASDNPREDDGKFEEIEGGVEYTENGHTYTVTTGAVAEAAGGAVLPITVVTVCDRET